MQTQWCWSVAYTGTAEAFEWDGRHWSAISSISNKWCLLLMELLKPIYQIQHYLISIGARARGLGWPRSSHRLTTVSSSDNFWWILIRDRLGGPHKAAVLETLWPSHPAITVWPSSNSLNSWLFFLASNTSILKTKYSFIMPDAMTKR